MILWGEYTMHRVTHKIRNALPFLPKVGRMKITPTFIEGGLPTFTKGRKTMTTPTFTEGKLPTFTKGRETS